MSTCSRCGGFYDKFARVRCGCGHFEAPRLFVPRFSASGSTSDAAGMGCLVAAAIVVGAVALVAWVVALFLNWVAHLAAWIGYALLFPSWVVALLLLFAGLVALAAFARNSYGSGPLFAVLLSAVVATLFVLYAFGAGLVSSLAAVPLHADRARLTHGGRLHKPSRRERAEADDASRRIVGEERRYAAAERVRLFLNPPRRPAATRATAR